MRSRFASLALLTPLLLTGACIVDINAGTTAPIITTDGDTATVWSKAVDPSVVIAIQNANGPIDVRESADGLVHVTASETLNGSSAVRIRIEESPGLVTVCSLYEANTRCADGTRSNGSRAAVAYTVLVPRSQRLKLLTGNGTITVKAGAPLSAITGNGDIDVTMSVASADADMSFTSGNGSIRLALPADYSARIDAVTGNGTVRSELPISLDGLFDGHRLRGTLGKGGALISMTTGNGQVDLKRI